METSGFVSRSPLGIPALGVAAGVYASRLAGFAAGELALAFAAVATLAAWSAWRGWRVAAATGVFAASWCAGLLAAEWQRPGTPPEIDFEPGEVLLLDGCVAEPPAFYPDREQFVLELAGRARVRVTFYLREGEQPPALRYGERVELEARLRKPRNYGNPGAFDVVRHLARRDVYWTATANGKSRLERKGACGGPVLGALYGFREWAVARLDAIYADQPYAQGMTRALLLGDSARLDRVWAEHFRRSGTYHALVISGLHLTTIAACLLFVTRVLALGPVWSLAVVSSMSWAYAIAAGGTAPVVRAAAGLTLYQVACVWFRRPPVLNILAAAVIAYLLADPEQLFDASFQLTVLSVAMIAAVAGPALDRSVKPFRRGMRSIGNPRWDAYLAPRVASARLELRLLARTLFWVLRVPDRLTLTVFSAAARAALGAWNLLALSAIVQVGLTLPMVLYFHRVSLTGLPANLAIVPLMNAAVPLGFLTIFTGWRPAAELTAALLEWAAAVARWCAALEPGWRIPDPPGWLVWAFLASLLVAAAGVLRGRWWPAAPFVCVFVTVLWHPFPAEVERGLLELTVLDVGQGESLLLAAPDGRLMLIDAGGFPVFRGQKANAETRFDVGEEVVSPYLFTRSIQRVDVIAVTHAHEDHMGGLRALAENFRPREVWLGAWPAGAEIRAAGATVRHPKAGERIAWGGAEIEVLSPPADHEPGESAKNDDSLVLLVRYGERRFLLTGDIERRMENRLLADGRVPRVDVLKVAHHGSRTSTAEAFLDAARPAFAVISAGVDNVFRHPHPDVVRRLRERGVRVHRTGDGMVTFRTDGRRIEVVNGDPP